MHSSVVCPFVYLCYVRPSLCDVEAGAVLGPDRGTAPPVKSLAPSVALNPVSYDYVVRTVHVIVTMHRYASPLFICVLTTYSITVNNVLSVKKTWLFVAQLKDLPDNSSCAMYYARLCRRNFATVPP